MIQGRQFKLLQTMASKDIMQSASSRLDTVRYQIEDFEVNGPKKTPNSRYLDFLDRDSRFQIYCANRILYVLT